MQILSGTSIKLGILLSVLASAWSPISLATPPQTSSASELQQQRPQDSERLPPAPTVDPKALPKAATYRKKNLKKVDPAPWLNKQPISTPVPGTEEATDVHQQTVSPMKDYTCDPPPAECDPLDANCQKVSAPQPQASPGADGEQPSGDVDAIALAKQAFGQFRERCHPANAKQPKVQPEFGLKIVDKEENPAASSGDIRKRVEPTVGINAKF